MDAVRIYLFRADVAVTGPTGDNRVRVHGGNACWTEKGPQLAVVLDNLSRAKNAEGNLSYCIFTSECLGARTIDDVCSALVGARYPAGVYAF